MREDQRWLKRFPAIVLEQIDIALEKVKDLDWRQLNRGNFPLPDAGVFFDDVREELENGVGTGQDRLLMRLWLSAPNSRALPEDHAVLWGDVGAGRPRGGIAQPATANATT